MNKRLKKKKTLKVIHISNTVRTPSGHNKKIGKRKRKKFFGLKKSFIFEYRTIPCTSTRRLYASIRKGV